jgi:hypothetical protein
LTKRILLQKRKRGQILKKIPGNSEARSVLVQTAIANTGVSIIPERAQPHRSAFAMEFAPFDFADQK